MTESKHTPWAVYENEVWTVCDDGRLGRPLFKSRMHDEFSWAPAWPRHEEGKALALAAAAPDLVEALKGAVSTWRADGNESAEEIAIYEQCKAAIAKAEGRDD